MATPALIALAQQSSARLIVAVLLLIGVTIIGGVVILAVRRHAMAGRDGAPAGALSLSEIRDLHARGELSDDEYHALRVAALGAFGYAPAPDEGERRAPPGVDLAGDPLPGFEPPDDSPAPESGNRPPE